LPGPLTVLYSAPMWKRVNKWRVVAAIVAASWPEWIDAQTPQPQGSARGLEPAAWQNLRAKRGERWAVVVGISKYQDPKVGALRFADRDAQAFHDFLLSERAGLGGFKRENTMLLLNERATTRRIRGALREFLKAATPDDVVYLYFAGHGAPDPERLSDLYLIAHDTKVDSIASTGVPMEDIHEATRRVLAEDMVIIVDACHSAGVGTPDGRRSSGMNQINQVFLQQLEGSSRSKVIMTASREAQLSQEDERWGGGHGVFTHHLLQGLRGVADEEGNSDGIVSIDELFQSVERHVRRDTRNAQVPTINQRGWDPNWPMSVVATQPVPAVASASPPAAARTDPPPLPAATAPIVRPMAADPMATRVVAVGGTGGRPNEYYAAAAEHGLWKTSDGGDTWQRVADKLASAVAVSESNPDIVYMGTGWSGVGGRTVLGDGVYKSTDGGRTWLSLGLAKTAIVSRVRVHPRNPNVVIVAAHGRLDVANPERGLYQSTDGGITWRLIKFISDKAGFSDVALHPTNPNVIYAASRDTRGSAGTTFWKTTDAGATWSELRGLSAVSDPSITVTASGHALALSHGAGGGLFLLNEIGWSGTWKRVNEVSMLAGSSGRLEPGATGDRLYLVADAIYRSDDGGVIFIPWRTRGRYHALWVAPGDDQRLAEGSDQGVAITVDGGRTWRHSSLRTRH
jgi:uncharacterized caspase-like protein/photosystem II stability/assembly factor-like uncharacterized protein